MNKKIIVSLIVGLSMVGFSQASLAKGKPAKSVKCDGQSANVVGTNKSDTIVLNDDGTFTLNGVNQSAVVLPFVVSGGNGEDDITGSANDDTICGGNGKDVIKGLDGSDRIFGENGKDTLDGDNGDTLCVEDVDVTCDDYVVGDNGNDDILGGEGDDMLYGGNGKDNIDAGTGVDTVDGGKGKDTCLADTGDADTLDECELPQ